MIYNIVNFVFGHYPDLDQATIEDILFCTLHGNYVWKNNEYFACWTKTTEEVLNGGFRASTAPPGETLFIVALVAPRQIRECIKQIKRRASYNKAAWYRTKHRRFFMTFGSQSSDSSSESNSRPLTAEERDKIFQGALGSLLHSYAPMPQVNNLPLYKPATTDPQKAAGVPWGIK